MVRNEDEDEEDRGEQHRAPKRAAVVKILLSPVKNAFVAKKRRQGGRNEDEDEDDRGEQHRAPKRAKNNITVVDKRKKNVKFIGPASKGKALARGRTARKVSSTVKTTNALGHQGNGGEAEDVEEVDTEAKELAEAEARRQEKVAAKLRVPQVSL